MRYVALDTETTGFKYASGERLVEIGCVEIIDNEITGNKFHKYINPQRLVSAGAARVHGLTNQFLKDKPTFDQVADEFADFIGNDTLVIHNAQFDMGFIHPSMASVGRRVTNPVHCTLNYARSHCDFPNNKLDTLCDCLGVDNSNRTLHGALLDAELLAEVFLRLEHNNALL